VTLGVDPGANLGLAIVKWVSGRDKPYVVLAHETVTTDTELAVSKRLATYGNAICEMLLLSNFSDINDAWVEVPWRRSRKTGRLSVYTRGGFNVAGIALLCAITGTVITTLQAAGLTVHEVPAPTGKQAKNWTKQKQHEVKMLTDLGKCNEHEAVAIRLAISGT